MANVDSSILRSMTRLLGLPEGALRIAPGAGRLNQKVRCAVSEAAYAGAETEGRRRAERLFLVAPA